MTKLSHSVAVTSDAYRELVRTSQMTGLPIGEIASLAVRQFLDEKIVEMQTQNRSAVLGSVERTSSQLRR